MEQFARQIARIKEKLVIARQTDTSLKAFGASAHQYMLSAPFTAQQMAAFERKYQVSLPDDYRAFLTQVGTTGAAPFYGLYSPEKGAHHKGAYTATTLSQAIVFNDATSIQAWEQLVSQIKKEEQSDLRYNVEYAKIFAGILVIGQQGGDFHTALIINGEEKGKVIYLDNQWKKPLYTFESNFLDWYERWLDEVISGEQLQDNSAWFGRLPGGTEEELLSQYYQQTDDRYRQRYIDALISKVTLSTKTIDAIEHLYTEENTPLNLQLLALLTKHDYERATPLLKKFSLDHLYETLLIILEHGTYYADHWYHEVKNILDYPSKGNLLRYVAIEMMPHFSKPVQSLLQRHFEDSDGNVADYVEGAREARRERRYKLGIKN